MKRLCWSLLATLACAPGHVVEGRPYELTAPASLRAGEKLPLIFLLHGYSSSGFAQNVAFPFSSAIESKRFLYALPNGSRNAEGKRFWNATEACCDFDHRGVDDVSFLRAVIADVKTTYPVDAARVYLIGHSNGAFMALRMACEASDVVTGVVSIAGAANDPFPTCPGPAIPVLHIHGTLDDTIFFDGGITRGGSYPSASTTVQDYAARNGCATTSHPLAPVDLVGDQAAETTREVNDGCPAGAPVELWSIAGANHIPAFHAEALNRIINWLEQGAP